MPHLWSPMPYPWIDVIVKLSKPKQNPSGLHQWFPRLEGNPAREKAVVREGMG